MLKNLYGIVVTSVVWISCMVGIFLGSSWWQLPFDHRLILVTSFNAIFARKLSRCPMVVTRKAATLLGFFFQIVLYFGIALGSLYITVWLVRYFHWPSFLFFPLAITIAVALNDIFLRLAFPKLYAQCSF